MPLLGRRAPSSNFIPMLKDILEQGKLEAKTDPSKAKITLRKIHRMISDADQSEEMAIEQNKNDVINILLEAGTLLFELSDKEKSIDYFEKVKEMDPNNADAWFEIGRILASQNLQLPYATVNLKKAIELEGTNYRAMLLLGDIYRIQRDIDNAMKWYYEALKSSTEKMEILDRILSIDPMNKDALKQKLKYLLEKGDRNGAAQIYLQLGVIDNSIEIIDEGIKISPDNISLLKEKARMLITRGKKSEAMQFLERVKKLSPGDPEIPLLENSVSEKVNVVQEDIFGDLGIQGQNNVIEEEKEPEEEELENILSSGKYEEIIKKYASSDSFVKKLDGILTKNAENYNMFIPVLESALKVGIQKEKFSQLNEKLGQLLNAIDLFVKNQIEDSEKILNSIVLKDQKNCLAWLYKARIAGLKQNSLGMKNFLMMARKLGNFDTLKFPELNNQ